MNGVEYNLHYANTSTRNPDYLTTDGVKTSYEYDSSGAVTKTTVQNGSGKKLISQATYSDDKNFALSSTDSNGSTVQNEYYADKGMLKKNWDPKGTMTRYNYNSDNDRPTLTYITGVASLSYHYDGRGRLEQLDRGGYNGSTSVQQAYHFDYDIWGNTESIQVWNPTSGTEPTASNSAELASYEYNTNGTLSRMNYPNGDHVLYSYDLLDRLIEEVYYDGNENVQADYRYVYNANGQLAKQYAVEAVGGVETVTESYSFEYDSLGRLIRSREENGSSLVQRTEHLYDSANRLTAQNWSIGSSGFSESYTYNSSDGTLATYDVTSKLPSGSNPFTDHLAFTYDSLKRLSQVSLKQNSDTAPLYTRNYSYLDYTGDSTRTTSRLGTYAVRDADNAILTGNRYEYDANGNITKIEEVYTVNGADACRTLAEYEYDVLNQLTKETRYDYSTTPVTTTVVNYTVDTAGNLRTVSGGSHTVSYTYGDATWADLLTGVSLDGIYYNISYASPGNPSNWVNESVYTNLTWTQGRRLSSLTAGSSTYSYEYDMSGVRTVKIADGLKHEYVTQNGKVIRETVTNASTGAFQYVLDFSYDEAGHPLTMRKYNNADMEHDYITLHYVCSAQGDVLKLIYQYNGNLITYAEYTYDAWGNVIAESGSSGYETLNPLRYRGYYYDTETGFYYLQSRYYDPIVKRFLNADSYGSTGQGFLGYNVFAYCCNGPVIAADYSGHMMCYVVLEGGGCNNKTDDATVTPTFPEDGQYINNQNSFSGASLPFGGETIGDCGCGVIASYNVLMSRGINVGFYDVYNYACSIHKRDGGLNKDEVYNIIIHFDPSIAESNFGTSSAVVIFYGYYSYELTDSGTISSVKRIGGHVATGVFVDTYSVQMHNAVGGDCFTKNVFDYLNYINYYADSKSSIFGYVEYVMPIR